MVTKEELKGLREGTAVSYGFYSNIQFVREDADGHVVLRDKEDNTKRIYTYLFLKHATVIANS